MFRKNYSVRINLPGGIVANGDLYAIVEAAETAKVGEVRFGTRQELFCKVADKYGLRFLDQLRQAGISYEANEELYPNIVSSYVTEDVFQQANWVSEGMYKDILDGFDYRPRLKINLIEASQSFVPFFTGHVNFISSPTGNYWYLFFRWPGTAELFRWKGLIYSRDIPRISRLIEEVVAASAGSPRLGGDGLFAEVQSRGQFVMQTVTEELILPTFSLPYYEGFNRYGAKLWLGIYRREEWFPLSFLKDICLICQQTKIGQLYATPWKSLIIKGIDQSDRRLWDYVLGKYRINVRHASNELNWHVEDLSEEGIGLKRYLVRQFDNEDIRTYGLCFAIKTRPGSGMFGSVVIRRRQQTQRNPRAASERYDILYTRDFNANSREYILFREGLEKATLGTYLASLCKYFYELQSESDLISHAQYRSEKEEADDGQGADQVLQCRHCLSLYDGVTCGICGAPGKDFILVDKARLQLLPIAATFDATS
ncbi:MAG: rubredoxin [Bacteroidota bacterium]|nr:rubredoxin [Bacteroidota bacterium]